MPGFTFVNTTSNYVAGSLATSMRYSTSPALRHRRLSQDADSDAQVGSLGTHNTLGLAKARAKVLPSTSEVYGDPQVHPQTEDYWGNVNPVGPQVYDEAKRFSRR